MAQTNANLIWKIADLLRAPGWAGSADDVTMALTIPLKPTTQRSVPLLLFGVVCLPRRVG